MYFIVLHSYFNKISKANKMVGFGMQAILHKQLPKKKNPMLSERSEHLESEVSKLLKIATYSMQNVKTFLFRIATQR